MTNDNELLDDFFNSVDWDEIEAEWEPYQILLGQVVNARYRKQSLQIYRGNPYIEALEKILTEEQFILKTAFYPKFNEYIRKLPMAERLHMVATIRNFFHPLSQDIDLEARFSRAIREGYRSRLNPLEAQGRRLYNSIGKNKVTARELLSSSTVQGFFVMGVSGSGKTYTIEAILSLMPQVILHSIYKRKNFTRIQIVWIKLDCPYNASIMGLCQNIFLAFDNILGGNTNYAEKYVSKDTNKMLIYLVRLCYRHGVGVIVIDEIQRLSSLFDSQAGEFLDFLIELINYGIPIVLVGTPRARAYLNSKTPLWRRGISQGSPYREHPLEDDEWTNFCKVLWKYQYTATPTVLTGALTHCLYYESAGVIDVAVKLYMLSQMRAIQLGEDEIISEELIKYVADEVLGDAKDMLKAIRERDYKALEEDYPDAQLIESLAIAVQKALDNRGNSNAQDAEKATHTHTKSEVDEARGTSKKSQDISDRKAPKPKKGQYPEGSLPYIVARATEQGISPHDALEKAGYIKNMSEFL